MSDREVNGARHPGADELLDLVLGLTPEGVRRDLLEHLAACPSCAARFREVAGSHERARSRQAAAIGAAPMAPRQAVRQPSRLVMVSVSIAAVLAVVAGLFVMLRFPLQPATRPPETAAWLPGPDPGVLARGGDASAADTTLLAGLEAYELRDLTSARRLLESAHATGTLEQVRRVYLANTLLHMGSARRALEQLEGLDYAALPEPWRGESRWALAQAFDRAGRRAQADSMMHQLATEPGPIGARARAGLLKPAR